jgi:uncharacterized membrane-anchored protein YhcB (DUF1043 family)
MNWIDAMNLITPFAVLGITGFGVVIWSIVQEMKKEMKEIAEVAYSARANSAIIEERRRNVEDKLEKTLELLDKLYRKIEELQHEIVDMKIDNARKPTPRQKSA